MESEEKNKKKLDDGKKRLKKRGKIKKIRVNFINWG
jgi:hypothetical protein